MVGNDSTSSLVGDVVARWVHGEGTARDALHVLTELIGGADVICGVSFEADRGLEIVVTPADASARAIVRRVAERAGGERTFSIGASALLDAADVDATDRWLLVEPLVDGHGTEVGKLVVLGRDAMNERLVPVPAVSRACALLVTDLTYEARTHQLTHEINNHLAAGLANIELLAMLLPAVVSSQRGEAAQAITHTREALSSITKLFAEGILPSRNGRPR